MQRPVLSLAMVAMATLSIVAPATSWAQGPEDVIRAQEIAFNGAYERNELDAYFAFYADDASLLFNTGRVTLADYRKDWYTLIEAGGRVEKNVISGMVVQMGPGDTSAVATYLLEVETRQPDGKVSKERAHETDVWLKRDDKWQIVHVHYTVETPAEEPK